MKMYAVTTGFGEDMCYLYFFTDKVLAEQVRDKLISLNINEVNKDLEDWELDKSVDKLLNTPDGYRYYTITLKDDGFHTYTEYPQYTFHENEFLNYTSFYKQKEGNLFGGNVWASSKKEALKIVMEEYEKRKNTQ